MVRCPPRLACSVNSADIATLTHIWRVGAQGSSSSSARDEAARIREMNEAMDRRAAHYGLTREQMQHLQDCTSLMQIT